ncbi:interferon alpha/beta receptor 2-like isoform X2 [Antennarius striatus]|uniref:interferon alpha/beta receptor 2-like isoform X2 n=1 Tax=Antennarius striatus TaxID=241820 RepID=UPI0035B46985
MGGGWRPWSCCCCIYIWVPDVSSSSVVVCVYLPAPANVTILSFNMEHTLSFTPGADTPFGTLFAVEILGSRKSWRPVSGCSHLMVGQTCNLTQAFKNPFRHYQARVQAFAPNQTSDWTLTGLFQPLIDTILGPPDVSVSGCGNCLVLQLRVPTSVVVENLKDVHRELLIHVQRTRDGAQFRLSPHFQEEILISYLQPGVEYCVTVAVKTLFNSNALPSRPHCAFTSPPPPAASDLVGYGVLSAVSISGFLLLGFFLHRCRLGLRLRRRRLSSSPSDSLPRGQTGGAAPPGRPGQTSAPQVHKDGSADCLLLEHRPVQPMRSCSERGKEDSHIGC